MAVWIAVFFYLLVSVVASDSDVVRLTSACNWITLEPSFEYNLSLITLLYTRSHILTNLMHMCCLCGVGKAEEVTCQHAACASDDRRAVKVRSAAADVLAFRLIYIPRVHSHGGGQPGTVIECKSLQVTLIVFASVQAILFVDETLHFWPIFWLARITSHTAIRFAFISTLCSGKHEVVRGPRDITIWQVSRALSVLGNDVITSLRTVSGTCDFDPKLSMHLYINVQITLLCHAMVFAMACQCCCSLFLWWRVRFVVCRHAGIECWLSSGSCTRCAFVPHSFTTASHGQQAIKVKVKRTHRWIDFLLISICV